MDTITVSAVAGSATLTVKVGVDPNSVSLSYTCTNADTTATAASALQSLLTNSADPRFLEIGFAVSAGVITCTANTAGTPFILSVSAAGGATATLAITQANVSPSDANDPANWNRSGVQQLPQNGDAVIVANSSVPILWNLDKLAAVQFGSYVRWQSMTGQIGLPAVNTSGYVEYRPTYFQFAGPPGGVLSMILGQGQTGNGPTLERYNVGGQQVKLILVASGGASDVYSVRFLGTNAFNVLNVYGSSLGVAMLPGEAATVNTATVLNGGFLALGSGCTFSGTLTVNGSSAALNDAPAAILAQNGSTVLVQSTGLTYPSVSANRGSTVTWLSDSNVSLLVLQTGSTFDKSQDARPMQIASSTQDGDTTVVRDNWSAITWGSPITFTNAVAGGPVIYGPGRTVKIV